jgi:peroxiredoxin
VNNFFKLLILAWLLLYSVDNLAQLPAGRVQSSMLQEGSGSLTKIGQEMPDFKVTTLNGTEVSIKSLRGKVVLINFWATWCGPCLVEMPRLEKDVWQKFKSTDFIMVAIAREESDEKITKFRKKSGFSFPMASDPEKKIFQLFASQFIPRNYVVGKDGTILYQSIGYQSEEFNRMIRVIEDELKRP